MLEPSSRRQRLVPLHDLLYTNTPTPPPVANANDASPVMALDRNSPLLAVGVGTRVAVLHVDALLRVEQDENVLVSVTSESPWLRLNSNSLRIFVQQIGDGANVEIVVESFPVEVLRDTYSFVRYELASASLFMIIKLFHFTDACNQTLPHCN